MLEEKETKSLYKQLNAITCRDVELARQAKFVAAAHREAKSGGSLSSLPSMGRVSTFGTVTGAKKKLSLLAR